MSNTFAIKEVLDFTVFSFAPTGYGNALFTVDYAGNTNIATTGERLAIRGGQGNFKFLDLDHSKDCTFSATLPIIDAFALAVKLGRTVTTGASAATRRDILRASSSTITLTETPIAGTLRIYRLLSERDLGVEQTVGTPATTPNTYSIAAKVITLNATTATAGTPFIVFYEYNSGVLAQNLKITASDFPAFITVVGRGIVDDDQDGRKVPISFKIHKAKVQVGFELTMSSSTATELDFTTDCYTILNLAGQREYINIVKLSDESY